MQNHHIDSTDTMARNNSIVRASGIFDIEAYLTAWPEVAASGMDPVEHYLTHGWLNNADPGPSFSTYYYLSEYADVRESGQNPLLHYLLFGKQEQRKPTPPQRSREEAANAPKATAPTVEEWNALIARYRPSPEPVIDVLIPVYRGLDETMRCIYSVLASTPTTPYNLLVVNDCSPEAAICDALRALADAGLFELHNLQENRGFVGACNYGMSLHSDRDILLLNSDTEVHSDWLDRIVAAAYRNPRTATVTPFSNNAEICSYPRFIQDNWTKLEVDDATLDKLTKEANAGGEVEIPTGVGFCMFVRRECLNQIGLLDYDSFGKGYGEENDLCRRAAAAGWRNILAADVFVRHYGAASFGSSKLARVKDAVATVERLHPGYSKLVGEFIAEDPVFPFRRSLDIARLKRRAESGAILFVLHSWGGGTEAHVDDLRELLENQGVVALLCKVDAARPNLVTIQDPQCKETPNLPVFDVLRDLAPFVDAIRDLNIRHVHIHHLAGFIPEAADFFRLATKAAHIQYDVTVHDYMPACPRINLVDRSGIYCGEPSISVCESCIAQNGSPFGKPSVWAWRERYSCLFRNARRVFVPDSDVKNRMKKFFPEHEFAVRVHPERPTVAGQIQLKSERKRRTVKRVALLGAIGPHKGSELLEAVVQSAKFQQLPLQFVIVGYSDRDDTLKQLGVEITGEYPREDAARLLAAVDPDFVWFSSVWPETYCYTLSAAFEAGIYPVAFDMGAISNRIKAAGWGKLLPIDLMLDPRSLAQTLVDTIVPATPDRSFLINAGSDVTDFVRSYYDLGDIWAPSPVACDSVVS